MPSQADVEVALVSLVGSALYPNGLASPPMIGGESRIYRGWPSAASLEADLAAGIVNVSVFALPNAVSDTTRYLPNWFASPVAPTLVVSTAGNTVTFSGVATPGQLAGVLLDRHSFVYRTSLGDTPVSVASALATAIAATYVATISDATITLSNATSVVARTCADASASLEVRRQRQGFRLTAWCPTPDLRDAACAVLDVAFAATPFLTLADGSAARLQFTSTTSFDERQDALLYRRDMLYTVEYPTTQVAIQPSMLFGIQAFGATTTIV